VNSRPEGVEIRIGGAKDQSGEEYIEIRISGINRWQLRAIKCVGLIFIFIGLYSILNEIHLFSSPVIDPGAGLLLIFITGLLTSAHCVGMCGGFVIAYATTDGGSEISKKSKIRQHLLYNIGRLGSYTFFGVLAGLIGAIFVMIDQYRGYLSIFAGGFMILYGLSVFFPWLRRLTTIRMPSVAKYTKNRGPLLFGLLNGLMPCGPLQAMLIYSAGIGDAVGGGVTMFIFALGTIPLMFGFGNVLSLLTHNLIAKIMEVSAVLVAALGLVILNRGLLLSGYGLPLPTYGLFSSVKSESSTKGLALVAGDYQEINMVVDRYGWNPDTFVVKKGVPVRWNIYVEKLTYCFQGIRVPKYGLRYDFKREGERVTLEFTPEEEGVILFTCWMGMARGDIIVKEDITEVKEPEFEKKPGVLVLKVRGMCCSGCARYLERFISRIDGVKSVRVDFAKRRATINFDPSKTSSGEIINAIKSLGRYDVQEIG
jgi:sulfite exporter TauE/SafE/copper chaperone CopZ